MYQCCDYEDRAAVSESESESESESAGVGVGVGVGRSRSRSRSRSRPESVVLTGVGVGVEIGKFSSTPTPARSGSRLRHFFIISFLVEMETKIETEHDVLTADSHDGLPCTSLLSLGVAFVSG